MPPSVATIATHSPTTNTRWRTSGRNACSRLRMPLFFGVSFSSSLERITSSAYLWHNYGFSTIGNRSDIERVPVENLRAFYRKYYQPDNALLVVAGKFEEERWSRGERGGGRRQFHRVFPCNDFQYWPTAGRVRPC